VYGKLTKAKLLIILLLLASPVLIAWQTQIGGGSGGGLPAGLTFASPTFTISSAGNGNGVLALSGSTSGAATFTAPAVAGTSTNPIIMSNILQGPNGLQATPTYSFTNATFGGMFYNVGASQLSLVSQAAGVAFYTGAAFSTISSTGINTSAYSTATKCAANGTAASPSVVACGAAPAGVFSCGVGAETVCTVNTTTMISANSSVIVTQDSATTTGTLLGVTCNTTLNPPEITAKVAATSFSITITAPAANPACYDYWIIN
jgi:hypothetical protein